MREGRIGSLLSVVVLVVSVAINVLQAQKIRGLTGEPVDSRTLVGTKAAPIAARTADGKPQRLVFDANLPTVLYYFSPDCGWCEKNWANVAALATEGKGRYRVVALTSATDIKPYAESQKVQVEILEGIADETLQTYRFSSTPHTVVIDAYGLVTHEWRGAFANRNARQIEELFGLVLPGLTGSPVSAK